MNCEEIVAIVRNDLPFLKSKFGVKSIGLFGSYAKNNVHADSDIDFVVELSPPLSDNYFGLLFFLEKRFQKKIDLVRRGEHLRVSFLDSIQQHVIYA